jgi:hypothetical protein
LDAIGKQPQLALTNQVIVEMGSGGEHSYFAHIKKSKRYDLK